MSTFCNQCGAPQTDDARFCESCGSPLAKTAPPPPSSPPPLRAQVAHAQATQRAELGFVFVVSIVFASIFLLRAIMLSSTYNDWDAFAHDFRLLSFLLGNNAATAVGYLDGMMASLLFSVVMVGIATMTIIAIAIITGIRKHTHNPKSKRTLSTIIMLLCITMLVLAILLFFGDCATMGNLGLVLTEFEVDTTLSNPLDPITAAYQEHSMLAAAVMGACIIDLTLISLQIPSMISAIRSHGRTIMAREESKPQPQPIDPFAL